VDELVGVGGYRGTHIPSDPGGQALLPPNGEPEHDSLRHPAAERSGKDKGYEYSSTSHHHPHRRAGDA